MKALFKILLLMAVFVVSVPQVEAQVLTRSPAAYPGKDSVIDGTTKYLSFFNTSSTVTGINLVGIKATGTVSAYAIVQVRPDTMPTTGTALWVDYVYPGTTKRDTLFFTDVATAQAFTWPVPTHFFNGVRLKIVPTGTQKFYTYASVLRR